MADIEQQIRDYYAEQKLDANSLERILQAGQMARRPWWRLIGARTAVAALAVLAAGVWFTVQATDENVTKRVGEEVVTNYLKHLDPEVTASSFSEIQLALPRLAFALAPSQPSMLAGWTPVGGRYCSLNGELAAQISLMNQNGEPGILYITPLTESLEGVDPCVQRYAQCEVHIWKDAHRLFVQARPRDQE